MKIQINLGGTIDSKKLKEEDLAFVTFTFTFSTFDLLPCPCRFAAVCVCVFYDRRQWNCNNCHRDILQPFVKRCNLTRGKRDKNGDCDAVSIPQKSLR